MSSVDAIHAHILAGHNVTAGVDVMGNQFVKVSGIGLRNRTEEIAFNPQDLADLREAVIAAVLDVVGRGCKISFYIDYYGRQWIEMRSGVLIQRKQKLSLPADVIEDIKNEVRTLRRARPKLDPNRLEGGASA